MKYKRFCASLCALLAAINCFPVFAAEEESAQNQILESGGNGSTQVDLTVTENPLASIFSATIPAVIPAAVDSAGVVTVPDNITIRNNNAFKGIQVTEIAVEPASTWELTNFDSGDFSEMNGNQLSLSLRGDVVSEESQKIGLSTDNWNIGSSDSLQIPMALKLSPQNRIGSLGNIASIVFTLDWADTLPFELTPENVSVIGYVSGAQETFEIPNTFVGDGTNGTISGQTYRIKSIESKTFQNDSILKNISIPSSVTEISQDAFYNCGSISTITIDKAKNSINGYPWGASNVGTIQWNNGNTIPMTGISLSASSINFDLDGDAHSYQLLVTFAPTNTTEDKTISWESSDPEIATVEDGLVSIGTKAGSAVITASCGVFSATCRVTTTIVRQYTLTASNKSLFGFTNESKSVSVPMYFTGTGSYGTVANQRYKVTEIDSMAFRNCKNLTSITLPNSIKSIEAMAFENCTSLTKINIPNTTTHIKNWAFKGCSALTSISMPDSVVYVGEGAFTDCSELSSVTFSKNMTFLGKEAFKNCSSLVRLYLPSSLECIEEYTFDMCYLCSVTLPEGVKTIKNRAFANCKQLYSITIPKTVTSIHAYAFSNTDNVTFHIKKPKDSISGSPWNCTNATVKWSN